METLKGFEAFVGSDLINHDGDLTYYVVAELPSGHRFVLQHDFKQNEAAADLTCQKINDAGVINLKHWSETDPAYGSIAHQKMGDFHLMTDEEYQHGVEAGFWA